MKNYLLKNIPEKDHQEFKNKSKLEGKSIRTKILELISAYINKK